LVINLLQIWIPSGEDWRGICDRFTVSSKEHILPILNVYPPVIQNPSKYYPFPDNCESLYKIRFMEDGIMQHVERFRRTMFTASKWADKLKWLGSRRKKALIGTDKQTVFYKYADEYYQAMTSCPAVTSWTDKNSQGNPRKGPTAFS